MKTFGPWMDGSDDAMAMTLLLANDEIWQSQCRDGDSKALIAGMSFPGAYLAVFRAQQSSPSEMIYHPVGYILYTPRGAGVFEQHTAFLELHRGKFAAECIDWAFRAMFLETSCTQLITVCQAWQPETRLSAKSRGAIELFTIPRYAKKDGKEHPAAVFGITVMEWAWRHHQDFGYAGEKWHDEVFADLEPHHEEDPAHNGFLGLALEMGKKQPHKAIAVYNAWASLAGYAPGELLWADAAGNSLIDIQVAIVLNGPNGVAAVLPKCPPSPKAELSH